MHNLYKLKQAPWTDESSFCSTWIKNPCVKELLEDKGIIFIRNLLRPELLFVCLGFVFFVCSFGAQVIEIDLVFNKRKT